MGVGSPCITPVSILALSLIHIFAASPSSISGLKEVGVKEADLFIAVTPDESRNMTACMLATNLGAKKTVARIDNYEYLLPKNKEFFQKLGVDSLIYPEMLAAKEIVSSMRMSWVRQWWEFCGGSLVLIGTKMREMCIRDSCRTA